MCLYHTYHWSCCPGTALAAPYYMNSKCEKASSPHNSRLAKQSKCKIEHRILDGADHDEPCPKCGQIGADATDETPPQEPIDPRYEQLAWAVGKLLQQQETLTALSSVQGPNNLS